MKSRHGPSTVEKINLRPVAVAINQQMLLQGVTYVQGVCSLCRSKSVNQLHGQLRTTGWGGGDIKIFYGLKSEYGPLSHDTSLGGKNHAKAAWPKISLQAVKTKTPARY